MTPPQEVKLAKSYGFRVVKGDNRGSECCYFFLHDCGKLVFVWYSGPDWAVACHKLGDYCHHEYYPTLKEALVAGQTIWERNTLMTVTQFNTPAIDNLYSKLKLV